MQKNDGLVVTSSATKVVAFWGTLAILIWVTTGLFPSFSYILWHGYTVLAVIWIISIIIGWIRTQTI